MSSTACDKVRFILKRCAALTGLFLLCVQLHAQNAPMTSNAIGAPYVTSVTDLNVSNPWLIRDWTQSTLQESTWKIPDGSQLYWIRFDSMEALSGFLSVQGQGSVRAWQIRGGDTIVTDLGFSEPMISLPVPGEPGLLPLDSVKNGSTIILRIRPFVQQPFPIRVSYINSNDAHDRYLKVRSSGLAYYFFLGAGVLALTFLAGFVMFLFYENRKKEYLYYGLYMLCMVLYFVRLLEYHFGVTIFWGLFFDGYGLAEVVALMLSYVMYILFVRYFLVLEDTVPGLSRFIRIWVIVCLAISAIAIFLSATHQTSPFFLRAYTYLRFAMPLFVAYFMWRLYRARVMYGGYVIVGTAFLLVAGLLALVVTFFFAESGDALLGEPMFFMLSGVFLESFCFALGLGKQARQTEVDKLVAQQQLTQNVQREAQLEKEYLAAQIQTLRAQMNPHFIFNALNSIQHFILSNDKEKSVKYLSRVAQLIRRILHNSAAANILLDEEIETLKSYVEIEQLRFHPAFTFTCIVDEELDIEIIRIPHLMIQPFVENAILHGLVHRKEKGELLLEILSHDEGSIEVRVTDNGIGREAAAAIGSKNPEKHNHISMSSIETRLRLMLPDIEAPIRIDDLKDASGSATGTRVTLIVPLV